jgi:hypothetical protein
MAAAGKLCGLFSAPASSIGNGASMTFEALSWHFESLVGEQFRRRGQARGWRHVPREVQGVVLKFPDPEYRCI